MFTEADRKVAWLGARQDRVVTRRQALSAGLSSTQIQGRHSSGAWQCLAPGVYVIGPGAPSRRQLVRAALLTLPTAVASHETAAELLHIGLVVAGRVVVTVPTSAHHASRLASVHRSRTLAAADVVQAQGLPATCRCRTLVDLASTVPSSLLARLVDDQLAQRLVQLEELRAMFERVGRTRRSMSGLRQILADRAPGFVAPESELEAAFIRLVERHGLPPPVRQFDAPWLSPERGRVDFAYPDGRVVVEVDGRRWHSRDEAVRRDRRRDRQAQLAGWLVLRYGFEEVTRSGEEVVNDIRRARERRGGARSAA